MTFLKAIATRRTSWLASPLLAALLLVSPMAAHADEATEVSRLIKSGQLDQAMARADVYLSSKPKDAQMRFLKGLILTEKNKVTDAITVFTKLTEDYPELPEPYNNLAVLYASQGQFDKARGSLEMAIRTHPSYATAHENLGDVYAKLASQSYDKALQLDGGNATAQTKLAMIRDLIGNRTKPVTVASSQPAPAAPAPVLPVTQPAAAVVAQAPAVMVSATPSVPAMAAPLPSATIVATTKPKVVVAEPPVKPKDTNKDEPKGAEDDVVKSINDWARAWSNQEVDEYLAFYDKDFETPSGQNRKRWEAERRKRIEGKSRIEVKVDGVAVSFEGGKAVARFKQTYTSDRLTNVTSKTLVLIKAGNKWQILEERAS